MKLIKMVKKTIIYPILLLLMISSLSTLKAQDEEKKKFGITFSGFIKGDLAFDTRQNLESREGFFLFYPLAPEYDPNGDDINASPGFNQYAMTSRLSGKISGPDLMGAKTTGLLEGDFSGPSNTANNTFRLRHAWAKLQWERSSFLIGQYWSPMDVIRVAPKVLALNTGAPFRSFSRNPQVRAEWEFIKNAHLIAVAYNQRDFASIGPDGRSYKYLRNAAIPNLHLQFQFTPGMHRFGFGVDFKSLKPRLKTIEDYKTDEKINSLAAIAFGKFTFEKWEVKVQGIYGENLNDHLIMGGYYEEITDTETASVRYTNIAQASGWIDIQTRFEHLNPGIFAGYAQIIDSPFPEESTVYMLGQNIENLWRISPRLTYATGPLSFLMETEICTATYRYYKTSGNETSYLDENPSNIRIHMAVMYSF